MLIFECKNPRFSYVLCKNPQENIVEESVRKGVILGWYKNPNTFCVEFFDPPNKSSFGKHNDSSGDYVDYARYCSRDILYFAIRIMFKHLLSKEHADDIISEITMRWNPVLLQDQLKFLKRQLNSLGWKIETQSLCWDDEKNNNPIDLGLQDLRISATTTFSSFVNILYLFSFCILDQHEPDGSIPTLSKVVATIPTFPYFMRKKILLQSCQDEKTFNKWKKEFETQDMCLQFGNNAQIRSKFVMDHLKKDDKIGVIVDFGCGDKPFVCKKRAREITYVGIDQDKEVLESLKGLQKEELNNYFFPSVQEAIQFVSDFKTSPEQKLYIVSTEVIEHVSASDARQYIVDLLQLNPTKFIITTPNKDFNVYYFIREDESRHKDHVNELSFQQFQEFIDSIVQPLHWQVEYMKLGDRVENVHNMSGCILSRKDSL